MVPMPGAWLGGEVRVTGRGKLSVKVISLILMVSIDHNGRTQPICWVKAALHTTISLEVGGIQCATSRYHQLADYTALGAIYAFPANAVTDDEAVDTLTCGVATSIDGVIVAELGVEGNGYEAGEGW